MSNFNYDTTKNDISAIKFGNLGAAGSESWSKGMKMKPYQIQKLRELLKSVEKDDARPEKKIEEDLENMFD